MFDSYLLMQFEYHYFISKYTYFLISSKKKNTHLAMLRRQLLYVFFLFNITIILHFAAELKNSETQQ